SVPTAAAPGGGGDYLLAVLGAGGRAGLLEVGHEVVDVGPRGADEVERVGARAHEEVAGGGQAHLLDAAQDALHGLAVDAGEDECAAHVEDLGLGDHVPGHVVLAQSGVGADDVQGGA